MYQILFSLLNLYYESLLLFSDKQPVWPGIAVFLQNALIFFRLVYSLSDKSASKTEV